MKKKRERYSAAKKEYSQLLCTKSGGDFVYGHLYAAIGWNNGIHVFTVNKYGDPVDTLFFNYGDELLIPGEEDTGPVLRYAI